MGHRSWFTTIKTKDDIASLDVILREGNGENTGKIDYNAGIYISYFAKVKKAIGPLKKGEIFVAWNSDGKVCARAEIERVYLSKEDFVADHV